MVKRLLLVLILLSVWIVRAYAQPYRVTVHNGNKSINGLLSGTVFNITVTNLVNMSLVVRIDTNASFLENKTTPLMFVLPGLQNINVSFKAPIVEDRIVSIYINITFYKRTPLKMKTLYKLYKTYYVIPSSVFSSLLDKEKNLLEKIDGLNNTIKLYKDKLNTTETKYNMLKKRYEKLENKYMNTVNTIEYYQNLYIEASKKLESKIIESNNLQLLIIFTVLVAIGATYLTLHQKQYKKEEVLRGNEPLT